MRKSLGLLSAAALMLPVGVLLESPAAAVPVVTCRKSAGSATFKPALPSISSSEKVNAKLNAKGSISKCKGGGVKSGTTRFTQTSKPDPTNCITLATGNYKPTVGKLVIKWNNGKKSVAAKVTMKQTKTVVDFTTTGKITAGLFTGKTMKGTATYKTPPDSCTKMTYTNKKGTKFVIK